MKIRRKTLKNPLTMIEMLIVITLIGIIGSVLALNLSSGLKKGKEFKTTQGKAKLKNILNYEVISGNSDPQDVVDNWVEVVTDSDLREKDQSIDEIINDGYGKRYTVIYDEENDEIKILSSKDSQ